MAAMVDIKYHKKSQRYFLKVTFFLLNGDYALPFHFGMIHGLLLYSICFISYPKVHNVYLIHPFKLTVCAFLTGATGDEPPTL